MEQNWKVSFDGGFFENHSSKRGAKEIKINKTVSWGEETVHIPSVYVCPKGLTMDILVEVDSKKVWNYINKYDLLNDEFAEKLTAEQREQMENDNPLDLNFNANVIINGKKLKKKGGSGCSWFPELSEKINSKEKTEEMLEYYGLDKTKTWTVQRKEFLWATVTKPKIKTLEVNLSQNKKPITAGYFEDAKDGDEVKIKDPSNGTEYTVKIMKVEKQSLDEKLFADKQYEYPVNCTELTYTVSPETDRDKFRIFDCIEGDSPRQNNKKGHNKEIGAVSVGVIGCADGPIAILSTSKKAENLKTAISSLHFDNEYKTKWRMVFYTKTREDLDIKLI